MDILMLVILSIALAGKFKRASANGAAKYILGMVGTVIVSEFIGIFIMSATGSYIGLIALMLVGICGVFFIYKAGAKKAASSVDSGKEQEMAADISKNMRIATAICAISAAMTGVLGYFLGFAMSPQVNWVTNMIRSGAFIFRTRNPHAMLFALTGIGMIVLSAGLFLLAFSEIKNSKIRSVNSVCAVVTLIYSIFLLLNSVFFRDIYQTFGMFRGSQVMSQVVPYYVPMVLALLTILALCLSLGSLYRHLNKTGRVLAIIDMVVFGIVGLFQMVCLVAYAAIPPMRRSVAFMWYSAPVLGLLLFASVMICISLSKKKSGN